MFKNDLDRTSTEKTQSLGKYTLEIYLTQTIALNYAFVMAVNKIEAMHFLSIGVLENEIVYDFVTTLFLTITFIFMDVGLIKLMKKSDVLSRLLFGR